MPVTSGSESIMSVFLVTSALFSSCPLSFLTLSRVFHFILFWKIHIEWFIYILYFLLPGIQLNVLRAGSKSESRRLLGKKSLLLSVWCKGCFFFNLSSFLTSSASFLRDTWVEILLGNTKTIGQMGALPEGCGRAIQVVYLDFKMGSLDIQRGFFLDLF